MDIRLLGPVEVVVDEQVRSLPGAGERELLALLALAAGRVVAAPALVDGLWGEALPVNPGNALQVRMSKLRRALRSAGAPSALTLPTVPAPSSGTPSSAICTRRRRADSGDRTSTAGREPGRWTLAPTARHTAGTPPVPSGSDGCRVPPRMAGRAV
jgi:hypothetical protein